MIGAEIDRLHVTPLAQIPKVKAVPVAVCEKIGGHDAVFELWWGSPLARYHVVLRDIPPIIVVQTLRSAIAFPWAADLEGLAIKNEDAGRALVAMLASAAERADVNSLGPAMHGVGPRVARLAQDFIRLDRLDDTGLARIGLRVDDVDA